MTGLDGHRLPQQSRDGTLRLYLGVACLLTFGSGLVSMGCQVVCAKILGIHLGHEILAACASVAGVMGGMAAGSWAFARAERRWNWDPSGWVVGIESTKAAWILVCMFLLPAAADFSLSMMGSGTPTAWWTWGIALLLPVIALLPCTMAMGAAWPALERQLEASSTHPASIGLIYACNTAGSCLGCLLPVFLLLPGLGFNPTLGVLAGLNGCIALGAWAWLGSRPRISDSVSRPSDAGPNLDDRITRVKPRTPGLMLALFWTGALGIGFEMTCVRALSQILENTVYSFGTILGVFLAANSLGAWLWHRHSQRARPLETGSPSHHLDSTKGIPFNTVAILAVLIAGSALWIGWMPIAYRAMLDAGSGVAIPARLAEFVVCACVVSLPAIGMGFLFTSLVTNARAMGWKVPDSVAANLAGGAAGSVIWALVSIPALGIKGSLMALFIGYLILLRQGGLRLGLASGIGAALLWMAPDPTPPLRLPAGAKLLAFREGIASRVAVIEGADKHRTLQVDSRFQMGGTAAVIPQKRQAHLPLTMHPNPQRALFIGPGTGITLAGAMEFPHLKADAVELVPEILEFMPWFAPQNAAVQRNPDVRLVRADARRFARGTDSTYDVIVCDLFHPARDGAGALYSRDHFNALRSRLAPGGLVCQWLPLYQMDESTLRMIVRSFTDVFPRAAACLLQPNVDVPVIGLIGTTGPLEFSPRWLESDRPGAEVLKPAWRSVGLQNTVAFLGSFVAGSAGLSQFSQGAPLNTDAHPRLIFKAPLALEHSADAPGLLLLKLLEAGRDSASDAFQVVGPDAGSVLEIRRSVAGYITARDIYVRGLLSETRGDISGGTEAYLASAAASVFFTPAYARCITLIQLKAAVDRASARLLYDRLLQARPDQPLGRQLLGPLFEKGAP